MQPDVYIYDSFPEKLKNQIVHIWEKIFKQAEGEFDHSLWTKIYSLICEEHGKKVLIDDTFDTINSKHLDVIKYFENLNSIDECIDVIEIISFVIFQTPKILNDKYGIIFDWKYSPAEVNKDINRRFLENGVGFQIMGETIIRIDNNILHNEAVLQTLTFLKSPVFKNVNDEFISAHTHFRHNRNKECLTDCLKALETTMIIICDQNKWETKKNSTANQLIEICIENKLIPDYLLSHFTSIRSSLESGIPTIRNKLGGHGQGINKIIVPNHFASYILYLTGTTINFLISCHNEIKKT